MDIILIDYYLRLFAIVANLFPYVHIENIKDYLRSSVLKELNPEIKLESLNSFNEYYLEFSAYPDEKSISMLLKTIREIDDVIPKKQKFQILLRLLLFEKLLIRYSPVEGKDISFSIIIEHITGELNISTSEYFNCKGFISGKFYQVHDLHKLLIVSDNNSFQLDLPFLHRKNFNGQLIFLHIENPDTILFTYKGSHPITYNKKAVYASSAYFFNKGSVINGEGFEPVYYNQVLRKFKVHDHIDLKVEVRDLEFKYKNSNHGIHRLNLDLESEQIIGIIGRSGVGKSTLIDLLIGNKQPDNGSITINGLDLKSDNKNLEGIIGYVSQDDLLLEELSVFMNLFLNAKLCFGDLPDDILKEKIKNLMIDLDLYEIRGMQVGSALNRLISGGQRKKLNIALELIREPWILFADEPTSGLSSSDSEEIMQLLSEQASKGKIVVVNIHQPSSDIFKMFDKIIVLDKEGYIVYFGNPLDSISYFNDYYLRVFSTSDVCNVCENVNPEAIFKVLEEKKTNEFGEFTKERKTLPVEWYQYYLSQNSAGSNPNDPQKELPEIQFNKPGVFKQFLIFSKRNLLTKIANYQYILLALLISPALATVLSFLCRYNNINESTPVYSFGFNENIPSYFFMSVIVALFLGLIMSAEEIIRDRKIILRESYLKLSKTSYLNSKVSFVFGISAIQSFLYVSIGNTVLDIQSMTISFWLILFSTSCFANLLGLFISSVLNSVIVIYILVPLIIVPQMLLSGVVVNFDKINKYVSSRENVPFVGDIMASRWAYEAMVVRQFCANDFQKHYFELEKQESNVKFDLLFVLPEVKQSLKNLRTKQEKDLKNDLQLIKNEIKKLQKYPFGLDDFSEDLSGLNELSNKLDKMNSFLSDELNQISYKKDSITRSLVRKFGNVDLYLTCKNNNYNNSLADLVLKRKELEPYAIVDNNIIRYMDPIYQVPNSAVGRAHFLSCSKRIGQHSMNTYFFNLIVIWLMSVIIYFLLVYVTYRKKTNKFLFKIFENS